MHPTTRLLDEECFAIVRSSSFIGHAERFLRKVRKVSDTTIRMITGHQLEQLARMFCEQHLDGYFPSVHVTGIPDIDLVCKEVVWQYKNLKTDLLNKSRLKRVPHSTSYSEPPKPTYADKHITSPAPTQHMLNDVVRRKRRRRRHRPARKGENEEKPVTVTLSLDAVSKDFRAPRSEIEFRTHDNQKSQQDYLGLDQPSNHCNYSSQFSLAEHPIVLEKSMPAQFAGQIMEMKVVKQNLEAELVSLHDEIRYLQNENESFRHQNQQLQAEKQHLETSEEISAAYRTFVETSLRLCQDTYLAEAQSARQAGIYAQTAQCNVVVDVLRDIQSDLDREFFSTYYVLHNRAPPSRYWIEGVQKRRERYDVFRIQCQ